MRWKWLCSSVNCEKSEKWDTRFKTVYSSSFKSYKRENWIKPGHNIQARMKIRKLQNMQLHSFITTIYFYGCWCDVYDSRRFLLVSYTTGLEIQSAFCRQRFPSVNATRTIWKITGSWKKKFCFMKESFSTNRGNRHVWTLGQNFSSNELCGKYWNKIDSCCHWRTNCQKLVIIEVL